MLTRLPLVPYAMIEHMTPSLVFATIAAESQRLINETYSAFVQGFLPTLGRPEVAPKIAIPASGSTRSKGGHRRTALP